MNEINHKSPNITIISREVSENKREVEKQQKKVNKKLEKMLSEKDRLKLLRNENREKAHSFFDMSKQAKERRDNINSQIQELKDQRANGYKDRDRIAEEKKDVAERLNTSTDKDEKRELYERLQETKKELTECYDSLKVTNEKIQKLAEESQENHINMKTYYQMGKQAHKTADGLHKDVVKISKEIKAMFNERNKLRRST